MVVEKIYKNAINNAREWFYVDGEDVSDKEVFEECLSVGSFEGDFVEEQKQVLDKFYAVLEPIAVKLAYETGTSVKARVIPPFYGYTETEVFLFAGDKVLYYEELDYTEVWKTEEELKKWIEKVYLQSFKKLKEA